MKGYLYVASGDRFVREAMNSAQSLRNVDETANITLVTDKAVDSELFDHVIVRPANPQTYKHGLLYKVAHIYQASPYDETLFLDSDTYICERCDHLFDLLEFFDVAIAPDPTDVNRARPSESAKPLKATDIYNTGVILFKKNQRNAELFGRWLELYQRKLDQGTVGRENDQTSFMEAWLPSAAKIYVLSQAWNARTPFFFTLNQSVKIIHGRHKDIEAIRAKLNKPHPSRHRCWLPVHEKCVMKKSGWLYHTKTIGSQWKSKLLKAYRGTTKSEKSISSQTQ
ncbi:MAG: hypothetical protein AAFY78_21375 [Cyanobacteria bacterium J06648_16]